jgi:hypothetical protein
MRTSRCCLLLSVRGRMLRHERVAERRCAPLPDCLLRIVGRRRTSNCARGQAALNVPIRAAGQKDPRRGPTFRYYCDCDECVRDHYPIRLAYSP